MGAKSDSVRMVADALNIGLDTVAFVDNDPLERAEVAQAVHRVHGGLGRALPGLRGEGAA